MMQKDVCVDYNESPSIDKIVKHIDAFNRVRHKFSCVTCNGGVSFGRQQDRAVAEIIAQVAFGCGLQDFSAASEMETPGGRSE